MRRRPVPAPTQVSARGARKPFPAAHVRRDCARHTRCVCVGCGRALCTPTRAREDAVCAVSKSESYPQHVSLTAVHTFREREATAHSIEKRDTWCTLARAVCARRFREPRARCHAKCRASQSACESRCASRRVSFQCARCGRAHVLVWPCSCAGVCVPHRAGQLARGAAARARCGSRGRRKKCSCCAGAASEYAPGG